MKLKKGEKVEVKAYDNVKDKVEIKENIQRLLLELKVHAIQ